MKLNYQKACCFVKDGVNVFQGTKIDVIKQIHDNYAPHLIRVHCMVHHTNLAMQIFLNLFLMIWLENLLQTFAFIRQIWSSQDQLNSWKQGNKIIQNVKMKWISILSLTKQVIAKWKTLLIKMALDNLTKQQTKLNHKHFYDP